MSDENSFTSPRGLSPINRKLAQAGQKVPERNSVAQHFNHWSVVRGQNQLTVKTRVLLSPPLVQPTSPEFPLGVRTKTFTEPGAEMTSVEIFTVSF